MKVSNTKNTNMGWECPRCNRTYAPWVASCTQCLGTVKPFAPHYPSVPFAPYRIPGTSDPMPSLPVIIYGPTTNITGAGGSFSLPRVNAF